MPTRTMNAQSVELHALRAEVAHLRAAAEAPIRLDQARQAAQEEMREANDRFRQMASFIDRVFWLKCAVTGEILYISPAYEAIWGRPCRSLYENPASWIDAVHREDRDRVVATTSGPGCDDYNIEYRITRPDGSMRWIRDRAFAVRDSDGVVYRVAGLAEDITSRREADLRMQAALIGARCLLWLARVRRGEGEPLSWDIHIENEEGAQRFLPLDVPEGASYTASWRSSILADQLPLLDRTSTTAILTGQSEYSNEFQCRNRDGQTQWLREDVQILPEADGNWLLVGACIDITERKKAEIRSAAFSDLGHRLSATHSAAEAGRIIVETAQSLVGWDACSFDLYSEESTIGETALTIDMVNGVLTDVAIPSSSWDPSPMTRKVIAQGAQLVARDPSTLLKDARDPDVEALTFMPFGDVGRPSACMIFVPAQYDGRVVGIISIHSYTPYAYDATDLATMQALADHCGGALERLLVAERLRESQERLQAILDNTPALISMKDSEGRYLLANRMFDQVFPHGTAHAMGKTAEELFPPELAAQYRAHDSRVFAGWDAVECEETFVLGVQRHVYLSNKFAVRDDAGSARAICCISSDITERKLAEQALRESDIRLRMAISAGQMNVWDWDVVNDVFTFSDSASIESATAPVNVGSFENFLAFTHPDDRDRVRKDVEDALADGGVYTGENRVVRPGQGTRWMAVRGKAFNDAYGWPVRMLGVSIDITDRRDAEEALQRKAEELARSNAELEQFAYVASHDLQEPLRMVSNYTQLLARRYKGRLDSDADDFIHFAVDGTVRMQNLIKDMLVYSRVSTCAQDTRATSCEEAIESTLANLAFTIKESGAVVERQPLPNVLADGTQLAQLFQNLLGNAIKFRGEQPPRISIGAARQGAFWEFQVSDNGIGIEHQYADRIFVIFQRLHSKEEYVGTGIGLAICKKIVERHGGRIWMCSEKGKGACVHFTLPGEQLPS